MNLPSCSLTSTSTYITKRSRAWSCTHANDRHHLKLLKLCVCRVNLLLQRLQHPKLCNTFQWWCGCDVTKGQTIKSKKRKGKKKTPHYHHEVKALLCYPQSHVSLNELALSYQSPAVDNVKERNVWALAVVALKTVNVTASSWIASSTAEKTNCIHSHMAINVWAVRLLVTCGYYHNKLVFTWNTTAD